MSGYKTYLGAILYGVCSAVIAAFPQYADIARTIQSSVAEPLLAIGLAHKLAKLQ